MPKSMQRTENRPLQSPRVILCEGTDEHDILCWVRKQKGLTESDVEIHDAKGRRNLLEELGDLRYQSGGGDVRLVAVVLDAEDRAPADLQLLEELTSAGATEKFRVIPFLLPDESEAGALETLARRCVDRGSPAVACADAWESCQSRSDVPHNTQAQKDKAWVHVWLAAHGDIYSRVGYAMKHSADVRYRLAGVLTHFQQVLDRVLNEPLD